MEKQSPSQLVVYDRNGTIADYDYDALGQLTYLENRTAGGEIISSYAYTLDDGGNRTKVVENDGRTVDYTYDDLNRLVSETISDGVTVESRGYTYDAVGNRLTMAACVDGDCESTSYVYNGNNQIISETTDGVLTQYFYDANGNTIEKDVDGTVTSYTYDDLNRLISVNADGTLVSFTYDADGARVSKTVDGTTTEYLLDKNQRYHQVLEERTDSGALIAEYVYGNQRISMKRGDEERFYHYDGHGSTSELTDGAGLVTDEYSYEAFGNLIDSTGIGINPFLYTGEAWDSETGMEYLRARYYVPGIGRFLSMDRHPGNMQSPLTLNKYIYGNGNPAVYIDPSGEFGIAGIVVTVAIVGALAAVAMSTSGCSSCNTNSNEINNLIIMYAEYPIPGGASGVIGHNAVAKAMPRNFREKWDVDDDNESAIGPDLDMLLQKYDNKKGKLAIIIFAHGGGGIAHDYSQLPWNWIKSVNQSKHKNVAGVFFGICQYGQTTDGTVKVTDNVHIFNGSIWENAATMKFQKSLEPNELHHNVDEILPVFFSSITRGD